MQKDVDIKDAVLKRHKLLNETCSLRNIVLSELTIVCMHCTCVHIIIITGLIIDVSRHILILECRDYDFQTNNKMCVPAMFYYENF